MLKEKPEERIGFESSLDIFKHEFFKENEDIINAMMRNNVGISALKYHEPNKLEERKESE
jgi:hypothetical protein